MSSSSQLQSLSARLDALSDHLKTTTQLIHRLAKLSFQPGSAPLESEEGDVRLELSSDIHESLKQQEEDLELLKQEVADFTAPDRSTHSRRESQRDLEKSQLSVQVVRLGEDFKQYVSLQMKYCVYFAHSLSSARSQFRKAQLSSKRNAQLAKQKEREILFDSLQQQAASTEADQNGRSTPTSAGGIRRGGRSEKLSEDEVLVNASSDVTAALRRTHQLMLTELQRSRFAQETLERGTAQLKELDQQYAGLDSLLKNSKSLLSTLFTSQKSDTWYLEVIYPLLCRM